MGRSGGWQLRAPEDSQQKGIHLKDRDRVLRFLTDWQLAFPDRQAYYHVRLKSEHTLTDKGGGAHEGLKENMDF